MKQMLTQPLKTMEPIINNTAHNYSQGDNNQNTNPGLLESILTVCKEGRTWLHVFLDSPMGSQGEIHFRQMVAEVLIRVLSRISPNIVNDRNVAPLVVEFTENILDRIKLRHHYAKGWIQESEYVELKIKHTVTLVCTVVNRIENKMLPLLRVYLCTRFPSFSDIINGVLSWFEDRVALTPQKAEHLLREWYTFKQNVTARAKELWANAVDFYDEKVKPVFKRVVDKVFHRQKRNA